MSENHISELRHFGRLKWFHWLVLGLSVALTLSAWKFSSEQHDKRIKEEFQQDARQIVDIIHERMNNYADSLWAGVAFFNAQDSKVSKREWAKFAQGLNLEDRYPGINGIGVIYQLDAKQLPLFLKEQRKVYQNFELHPRINDGDYWPITYVVPENSNKEAIGLDISHEENRLKAAILAKESRQAQITGPIILVQDKNKTPGFLFYAPIYEKDGTFIGHVYAPFVISKLIYGVLLQKSRNINFALKDEDSLLYNEHLGQKTENSFKAKIDLDLYGRTWTFDLRSTKSFEERTSNSQPLIILIGGFIIDFLLLGLFLSMSRSNKRAAKIAQKLANEAQLQRKSAEQASKLASLGEMAGGIAHEINNPLSVILTYSNMMGELDKVGHLADSPDLLREATVKIDKSVKRITVITDGLRTFSRDGTQDAFKLENLKEIVQDTIEFAQEGLRTKGINLEFKSPPFVSIKCQKVQLSQVLINLINNAKHEAQKSDEKLISIIVSTDHKKKVAKVSITNSGAPISEEISEKLFQPFFTTKEPGEGTGLGLSISKTIIDAHNGDLYLDKEAKMTTFIIEIPLA